MVETTVAPAHRPAPGTGRLNLVSGYFTLFGALGAAVTAGMAVAVFFPKLGWVVTPAGHPYVALVGACAISAGLLWTSRLLRRRRRDGAWMAVACFGLDVASQLVTGRPHFAILLVATLGLALTASVWRHLE